MILLTIITPCYNAEKFVEGYLSEIAKLDCLNLEVLIVDGGSTDKTLQLIKSYEPDLPFVRLVSEADEGVYDAMNKGIKSANGKWLYFLGMDDKFLANQQVLNKLESSKSDVIYGDVLREGQRYDGPFDLQKLSQKNVCHQAMFFSRKVFEFLGNYDLKYRILSDYEFNIRLWANDEVKIEYIDEIIGEYDTGGVSSTIVEERFILDMPNIFAKYGAKEVDLSAVYEYIGKLGLQRVYNGDYTKGMKMILKSVVNGGSKLRLREAFAHIRRNLIRPKKV